MKYLLAVFLLCVSLQAQTAKVVALSSEDAAKAKQLFEKKQEIEAQIEQLHIKIAGNLPKSWDYADFEYSDDFKFVVPKVSSYSFCGGSYCGCGSCGCIQWTNGGAVLTGATSTTFPGVIAPVIAVGVK